MLNNWLAIVGLLSLMYWAWRVFAMIRRRSHGITVGAPRGRHDRGRGGDGRADRRAPPVEAPGPGAPLEDIAAIAAAVTAMLGAHRIIHLEAVGPGHWAFEGRWAQQTSHNPG